MSETVLASFLGAIIAVAGGVIVNFLLIEAGFKKIRVQLLDASLAKKENWLLEVVSELVYYADPERRERLSAVGELVEGSLQPNRPDQLQADYRQVLLCIHKVQLILDPRDPIDRAISDAASALGHAFRDWTEHQEVALRPLLDRQSALIEATREYFRRAKHFREQAV